VNPEDYERAMDALFHDTDLMMFAAGRPVADILEAGPTGPLSRENAGWLIPLGRHLGVDVDVMAAVLDGQLSAESAAIVQHHRDQHR